MSTVDTNHYPKLSSRISLVFVMVTVMIALITIVVSRATQTQYLEEQAQKQYEQLTSVLLVSSIDAIIAEDVNLLANLVQETAESDRDIAFLRITNDEQKTLAQWDTPRTSSSHLLKVQSKQIIIHGKSQGQIELWVDLSYDYQQIDAFVLRNSLIIIVLLLGLLGIQLVIVRKQAIEPIQQIEDRLFDIEVGNFQEGTVIGNSREIVQLSQSLNKVASTLREQRSAEEQVRKELQVLNNAYVRFVPNAFLDLLGQTHITDVKLGDHQSAHISILFSDIRSFTPMAEGMSANETFLFINAYLAELGPVVRKNNGFIDKYIGDAIMAIFTSADDAVKAGTDMFEALARFNAGRDTEDISIGVGIHTGIVMLGTIGEKFRMEGTVIGDVVNLAGRLETLTKEYDSSLLISEATKSELTSEENYEIAFVDEVLAKGKSQPTKIFGVLRTS